MRTVERLYETFKPETYAVSFDLTQPDHKFSGQVTITGQVSGNQVKLHAKQLELNDVKLNGQPADFSQQTDDVVVITNDDLVAGQVTVEIGFAGHISDAMHGIYPCYFELDGRKQELIATQFESHHAREAFPCVDEPEAKASFDVELITKAGLKALSNMPIDQQSEVEGRLTTRFATTPIMSSYLLAFVVGDLQSKSTRTSDGVEVTTWATKAQPADSLDFGLDVAKRSIEFFNDYFGVKYPLPKADHVALPDFSSGAMENWGLITYREVCLLADKNTSISSRQYVATVIAHETSHQWFGNLVTMRWWDDLWLNESFATLMEYVCVDALFPDWNIWLNFASQEVLMALRRDYLPGVQAVKCEVNHPDEISTLFDSAIVYAKGARLLVMARAFVGDEAFRSGLADYFDQHKYKNTIGDDLWQALSAASGKDVATFMTPWLTQSGYPKIKLRLDGDLLTISQDQFLIPAGGSDKSWPVPLNAQPASLPDLLDRSSIECKIDSDDAVLVNHQAASHVVVQYDEALMAQLIDKLASLELQPVDRLSLLHDSSLLSRAGDLKASQLLDLIEAYRNETDEPVWDIISLAVADLKRLIETDDAAETAMKQRVSRLAQPTYKRLGWRAKDNEPDNDAKLRPIIAGLLAWADNQSVIDEALKDFQATANLGDLNGEMRSVIFAIVTKHGPKADIERLIDTHQSTANSELQTDIVAGLTATRNPDLAKRLIDRLKDGEVIRPQDIFRWFAYLIRNRHARNLTWQWLVDNWDWIEKTFGGDKSYDDFAKLSAAGLSSQEWLDRYRDFWGPKQNIPALKRAIELGIKDIEVR
ncbi:MAG TPA: M1 family metallopeptidase, partial [Candidatus Saccharimonadales bacterium]|nr:M1 family metallopeptidase [Candidatus Saccharimonadales bacterium]